MTTTGLLFIKCVVNLIGHNNKVYPTSTSYYAVYNVSMSMRVAMFVGKLII